MSEDVYGNADSFHNTKPAGNTDENICMNDITKGSQMRTPHSSGGQDRKCAGFSIGDLDNKSHIMLYAQILLNSFVVMFSPGRYKLAVVLVCILLLAITITILKTNDLQLRYKSLLEEKDQLQHQYNNITADNALLEERNAFLIHHESQLETNFNAVMAERDELQRRLGEIESHHIKQHAVDVILDPDTAALSLILSADGKQVKTGDTRQNLPDNPKRFNKSFNVLGREGFSTGKFYYEVQVKGKTRWTIGVARESINRKGQIYLSPEYGLWTIWLRNGTYKAHADPSVTLSLKGTLQTVGVFVDYGAGLVSFYDSDCWNHIYSFTNVSFTEKIYPFFSPNLNKEGKNSAPLIISPVHGCPIK
ncbi:erythroid membrane-associated protein-like isoform X1 [Engraulis encrasicolus]|uniref:erythroid membrane-associated protein-like isoform X1 n=1 Tax=Engraulis encrasicolus TaxID=184585 RepID=UPI002FD71EC6